MFDQDFGHLCRGRRIQMSGHSDFSVLSRHGEETFVSLLSLSKLPVLSELDVESARFPAKSESWNKLQRQC